MRKRMTKAAFVHETNKTILNLLQLSRLYTTMIAQDMLFLYFKLFIHKRKGKENKLAKKKNERCLRVWLFKIIT